MANRSLLTGTVTRFTAADGLGVVTSVGGDDYPFHCTAIANGSRTIEVGESVTFTLVPSLHGRHEARALTVMI